MVDITDKFDPKDPWNPDNWNRRLWIGNSLHFNLSHMSREEKKAVFLELQEQFPDIDGKPQISLFKRRGGLWRSKIDGPAVGETWVQYLESHPEALDSVSFIGFNTTRDKKHWYSYFGARAKNKETFRAKLHAEHPDSNKKKDHKLLNVLAKGSGLARDATFGVGLTRWEDLLAKIAQAETFDELAQNVMFAILFLPLNAIDDELKLLSNMIDKWAAEGQKKVDEMRKARLDKLRKSANDAKGGDQKSFEALVLANLLSMDEKTRAEFASNLQTHPELIRNNLMLKKALENPDIQRLIRGAQLKQVPPHVEITTNTAGDSYKKEVTIYGTSGRKFTLERTGTPGAYHYTYKIEFLKDGEQVEFSYNPTEKTYKYKRGTDTMTFNPNTKTVTKTTGSGGIPTTLPAADAEKEFRAIAPYIEDLKQQDQAFAKDLKTLDLPAKLRGWETTATRTSPPPTRAELKDIQKKLHELGININPTDSDAWEHLRTKADEARKNLLDPVVKRTGDYVVLDSHGGERYTLVSGEKTENWSGFQEAEGADLMSDGSWGLRFKLTTRLKPNERTQAVIKEYQDGSYQLLINKLADDATAKHQNNQFLQLQCHKHNPSSATSEMDGTVLVVQNGVHYQFTIKEGLITECLKYTKGERDGHKIELFSLPADVPCTLTEADIRATITELGKDPEAMKSHDFSGSLSVFQRVLNVRDNLSSGAEIPPPPGHSTLTAEQKAERDAFMDKKEAEMGTNAATVTSEIERRKTAERYTHDSDGRGGH
ncbi:MAG: hypothetical protein J6Y85_02210 [Alphaproteobacteria bacterium]|nr:hypothetical protein [Alphaproteobacteria bacterium]